MSRGAVGVRVEQAAGEAEPRDGKGQGRRRGREAGVEASPRQWRRRRAQGIREVTRQGTPRAPPRSSVCSLQPLISRPDHVPRAEFDKPPPPPRVVTFTPRIHSRCYRSRSCARRRSWSRRQTRRRAPAPSTGKPTPTRQPTWRPSCRTGRCSAIEPPGNGGPRCRASQKAEGEWPG